MFVLAGVSERIVLDGVNVLTQLQQLELLISSGVEAFVQGVKGLSSLTAQCALSLPFDQELDLQPLTCLTRLQFQVCAACRLLLSHLI